VPSWQRSGPASCGTEPCPSSWGMVLPLPKQPVSIHAVINNPVISFIVPSLWSTRTVRRMANNPLECNCVSGCPRMSYNYAFPI
jgi:hypothetical protein